EGRHRRADRVQVRRARAGGLVRELYAERIGELLGRALQVVEVRGVLRVGPAERRPAAEEHEAETARLARGAIGVAAAEVRAAQLVEAHVAGAAGEVELQVFA